MSPQYLVKNNLSDPDYRIVNHTHNTSTDSCQSHSLITSDVVLGLGPWSLVVLKDKFVVLEPWVLGPGLGLAP